MPLTNAGRDFLVASAHAAAATPFNNANAHIGVGDSTTAFAASQVDLQASTNKARKPMDATYPQVSGNSVAYRSTFGTTDANHAWYEWAVFNAPSGGTMMNRKQETLGTKVSSQVWVLTVTLVTP